MSAASSTTQVNQRPAGPGYDGVENRAQETSPPPQADESEENYKPRTLKFWSIIISVFLALFLVALDRTIISTAIPQITADFQSLGDVGWYGSAYQLTTSASQLIFGRIYNYYSIKETFLLCIVVFEVGSVICALAPNSIAFILGRAIAGLGGAGIFSGCMIIMIPMIPLRNRAMFQGLFGMVFGISSVMGPIIGGAFTVAPSPSWRWCFWVNLPIGAVTIICLLFLLKIKESTRQPRTAWQQFIRLDPLGTLLFVPSIVCLLIALQWGGSTYAWSNWRIIVLLALFGTLWIAFMAEQVWNKNNATIPPRILTQRSVLAGAFFMMALAGSMLMSIYFLPMWFQVVQGVDAVQSGIYFIPFVLSLVIGSILSGGVTQRIGYYVPAMLVSPSVMAVGLGLMSTFKVNETSAHWIGYQFIAGFGLGCGMQLTGLATQAVLPKPDIPTGISIMFFSQQLGGAIFTSVGQNMLSSRLVRDLSSILPNVQSSAIVGQGATDLMSKVPKNRRGEFLQIYNHAITRIFLVGMGVALVGTVAAFFMEWKNLKKIARPAPPPFKDLDEEASSKRPPVLPEVPQVHSADKLVEAEKASQKHRSTDNLSVTARGGSTPDFPVKKDDAGSDEAGVQYNSETSTDLDGVTPQNERTEL